MGGCHPGVISLQRLTTLSKGRKQTLSTSYTAGTIFILNVCVCVFNHYGLVRYITSNILTGEKAKTQID